MSLSAYCTAKEVKCLPHHQKFILMMLSEYISPLGQVTMSQSLFRELLEVTGYDKEVLIDFFNTMVSMGVMKKLDWVPIPGYASIYSFTFQPLGVPDEF